MNTPTTQQRLRRFASAVKDGDFSHHRYALWKRWHRLDLGGESCVGVGLNVSHCHDHAESGGPELDSVLRALNLPQWYNAVDLGSGKGGAAFTLAKYFTYVTGVELAPSLVNIAWKNAVKLRSHNVNFVCLDATAFRPVRLDKVFYMFNPFPKKVVFDVMTNLMDTLRNTGETVCILYKNPIGHDEVLRTGFTLQRIFNFNHGWSCNVYIN
jgi:SAM-dependent methyltransferase